MDELDSRELTRAIEVARGVWAGVEVAPALFAEFVSARLAPGQSISSLKISDLYLACACAANDQRALRYFDERMLPTIEPALRRLVMSDETIDETKQVLR